MSRQRFFVLFGALFRTSSRTSFRALRLSIRTLLNLHGLQAEVFRALGVNEVPDLLLVLALHLPAQILAIVFRALLSVQILCVVPVVDLVKIGVRLVLHFSPD